MESRHYRPTRAEISLDALQHNIQQFRQAIPRNMKLMAVLKADAYGHGAVPIAKEAIRCGADYLSVAFLDEALQLRKAGIQAPILVLGYTGPDGLPAALEHDITLAIYSDDVLEALSALPHSNKQLKVHIKLDTGMGRIGLTDEQSAISYITKVMQMPHVSVEGLFTHFARADEQDKTYTYEQVHRFERVLQHFRSLNIEFPCNHTGNSAAAIDMPECSYNMVRVGISLYGFYPSEAVCRSKIRLEPVMTFKTQVVHLKKIPPGSGISYGHTYRSENEEQIATLPVGYADGYTRMLSNKAEVLIRGQRAPVVGRICMDQTMIRTTHIPHIAVGDEVILFGKQSGQELPADELANLLGTIHYEMVCMVARRVPRIYLRNGLCVEEVNYLREC